MLGLKMLFGVRTPKYLLDSKVSSIPTEIIGSKLQNSTRLYQFSETIFHLQGGGQPNDAGFIELQNQDTTFPITGGVIDRVNNAYWYDLQGDEIPVGQRVTMTIDAQLRNTHSKIHSAGHLLDLAVLRLGYQWENSKAYHFTDHPFVEYVGLTHQSNAEIKEQLQQCVQTLIAQNINIDTMILHEKSQPEGQTRSPLVRIVSLAESSCPCAGTHVESTEHLEGLYVKKVSKKGKKIRVSYQIE